MFLLAMPWLLLHWVLASPGHQQPWTSCQILNIACCACTGNIGYVFPADTGERSRRTSRDACLDRWLAVSFEIGGGENVPGIPGACATRNFTYARGPWHYWLIWHYLIRVKYNKVTPCACFFNNTDHSEIITYLANYQQQAVNTKHSHFHTMPTSNCQSLNLTTTILMLFHYTIFCGVANSYRITMGAVSDNIAPYSRPH